MAENHHNHHLLHHTTKLYEFMSLLEERNKDRIQYVIQKLLEVNHIKQNEVNDHLDVSHCLQTYKAYNKLSAEDQARYVLKFFRSEAGYALIHGIFLAHMLVGQRDFNGKIDFYHNREVDEMLENFGINKNLKRKRDRDLIRFLEDIYSNLASYYEKFHKSNPPTQQHEYSHDELLSFHLVMGFSSCDASTTSTTSS